ncbi:RDD family protein [Streptomyces sp. SID6648]|nr:RDD family protein [Streptomyces sp. SID6648]
MHGYGPMPQQPTTSRPSPATLTTVRVILVALTVLSCGLLGWAPMLRLAIVTRRPRDWFLLVVVVALNIGLFAFIMATPDDPDQMSDAAALFMMLWILGLLAGVITYYLYAEIRHYNTLGAPGPYGTPGHPAPPLPYQQQHVAPHQQHPQPQPQQHQQPNPYTAPTTPPTPTPAPQRLDQVRAELDELSDYLRKENKDSRDGEGR